MKKLAEIIREEQIRHILPALLLCVIAGICINISVLSYFDKNEVAKTSGVQYRDVVEYIFPDTLKTEEDIIKQYFVPQNTGMSEIHIRLAYNNPDLLAQNGAKIRLCLEDENGNVLQEELVSSNEISNWRYYILNLDMRLKRGVTYCISLSQMEGAREEDNGNFLLSYVPFIYKRENLDDQIKENGICLYNGIEQDYEWDLYYVYLGRDEKGLAQLVIANLFFFMALFGFPVLILRYRKRWWLIVYAIISPLWFFCATEMITGNISEIEPQFIALNIAIYCFAQVLFLLFYKHVKRGLCLGHLVFPLLAMIEYYVHKFRGRSFMVLDIFSVRTAGKVMAAYSYEMELIVGVVLLITVLFLYVLFLMPKVELVRFHKSKKILVVLATIGFFSLLTDRVYMSQFSAASISQWNIESNYETKGYLLSLVAEMQFLDNERPEGYSVEAVRAIGEKYEKLYLEQEDDSKQQPENIILIMNESWADFRKLSSDVGYETVTPFIDSLSEDTIKGSIHVPAFGAGTASSEYEVLTGNSMQFFTSMDVIAYQLYSSANEWGIVSNLKSQNWKTIALHPYAGMNWNRKNVYPNMRFDEFYAIENWPNETPEIIRWYTTDESCYDTVIELYEETEEKLFTFLVTIQNHGGYEFEGFESTVNLQFASDYPRTEQYLSLIQETDRAFEKLINHFSKVDEDTMIIMFGDHYPAVEDSYYERLLGTSTTSVDLEKKQELCSTPFVIWTNYDIEEARGVEISANYFGSYILELAGIDMPIYNKCLLQFYKEMPVIGLGAVMDTEGKWYDMADLSEEQKKIIDEYKILQYNRVFGGKNRVDEIFSYAAGL